MIEDVAPDDVAAVEGELDADRGVVGPHVGERGLPPRVLVGEVVQAGRVEIRMVQSVRLAAPPLLNMCDERCVLLTEDVTMIATVPPLQLASRVSPPMERMFTDVGDAVDGA